MSYSYPLRRYQISTWSRFPKVNNLRRKFTNLHQRFISTTGAFPEVFHDIPFLDKLHTLSLSLENPPQFVAYGDYSLMEDYKAFKEADKKHARYSIVVRILCQKDVYLLEKNLFYGVKSATEQGVPNIIAWDIGLAHSFSPDIKQSQYIIHSPKPSSHLEEDIPILIDPTDEELTKHLGTIFEKQIVRGFECMYLYLQQFLTSNSSTYDTSMTINYSKVIRDAIKDTMFDNDVLKMADTSSIKGREPNISIPNVLDSICRRIHCALVTMYSSYYNIPIRLCHTLLTESRFTTLTSESVSQTTRKDLSKLLKLKQDIEQEKNKHGKSTAQDTEDLVEQKSKIVADDILTDYLFRRRTIRAIIDCMKQSNVANHLLYEVLGILKRMEHNFETTKRVTTVMKKMTFEIKGYLKQSSIKSDILAMDKPYPKISNDLRLKILRNDNVHTVGTVFGELQIHLKPDVQNETNVRQMIARLINDHNFGYPYTVKVLDHYPKLLFRQGDRCHSSFPNNSKKYRSGTVGCFVKDQNDVPHLITNAHVVDPGSLPSHSVLIEPNCGRRYHFGSSTPQKTYCCGSGVSYPVVDIAAVTSVNVENITSRVDYSMRDENGETKPVSFLLEITEDLVGETVYKYGAETGLTHGLIASTDLHNDNTQYLEQNQYYMVFIESLPVPEVYDKVLGGMRVGHGMQANVIESKGFGVEGDSGSVICLNYFEDNTIMAACLLTGGDYIVKDKRRNITTKQCFGFLLARGLEKLCSRQDFFVM
ncbi:hypothetical protein ACF0H5_006325 [Mactra antiquata]